MPEAQFARIDKRFARIDQRLDGLTTSVADLKTGLDDTNRHMRVFYEDVKGDIRMLAEHLAGLDARMARGFLELRQELASHLLPRDAALRDVAGRVTDHERRIGALEQARVQGR